ncbi:MAG: hypothetical protein Q9224_005446 [Gallowayella concinna]
MRLLFTASLFCLILPILALTISQPHQLSPRPNAFPQPFIFTRHPYTINYTHDPFQTTGGPTRPTTNHHNVITAVNNALTRLQNLRSQSGAIASDPIPTNTFTYEIELDRQPPIYLSHPRRIQFVIEGRFAMMPELGLKYQEVGVVLVGLLRYADLFAGRGRASVSMCRWEVGDLRSHPDVWIARGSMRLIVPDVMD